MQILPRTAPRRALTAATAAAGYSCSSSSSNVSSATRSFTWYRSSSSPSSSLSYDRRQAPFVCPSCCRRFRSQPRAQPRTQPRRSFSAATATVNANETAAAAAHVAAPPPPPSSGYARLTTRSLISIAGVDAPRFLQGIITSSITEPDDSHHKSNSRVDVSGPPRKHGFYSGFLNATGRVLHDVFVYPDTLGLAVGVEPGPEPGQAFLIEVDAAQRDVLLRHLKRYKLRSKIALRALGDDECAVWQVWGVKGEGEGSLSALDGTTTDGVIVLRDARAPGMGYRVLSRGGASPSLPLPLPPPSDEPAYRVRRYLLGVPEGQAEIPREHALPLESNLDLMGGIDFRKGCYVGQELTIRTRHRGVVRKRVLPCALYGFSSTSTSTPTSASASAPTGESPPPPQELTYEPVPQGAAEHIPPGLSIGREGKKGRSAGTWLAGAGNVGLALCRLQVMTDVELPGEPPAATPFDPAAHEFVMRLGEEGDGDGGGPSVKVRAFVPGWVRERLKGG